MQKSQLSVALVVVLLALSFNVHAQQAPAYALKNVVIHDGVTQAYNGHIVWRNGIIEAIGESIEIPFDAHTTDGGDTLHVYSSIVDGAATWGSPDLPGRQERPPRPGDPTYDRAGIQPDRVPSSHLKSEDKSFAAAYNAGIGVAALGFKGNMFPGSIDVFTIDDTQTKEYLFKSNIGQKYQFTGASGVYPSTLMAMMAKTRQLFYDATALKSHQDLYNGNPTSYETPKRDLVLESLFPVLNKEKPLFAHIDSRDDIQRLLKMQDELGFNIVLVSGKAAYTMAQELKNRQISVLASIDISKKPEWMDKSEKSDSLKTDTLSTDELAFREKQESAWILERDNIKSLLDQGVLVGFASNGMDLKELSEKMKYLTESGLSESQLNAIFTVNSAKILGIDRSFGRLSPGYVSNIRVYSKEFSNPDTKLLHVTNGGALTEIKHETPSPRGRR
ncbi:MAG TPA: hypothetical protein DCE78_02750 [Bacteroidetes bacterium]|nr:hypothetical protein [Bacteroidota bacterium]